MGAANGKDIQIEAWQCLHPDVRPSDFPEHAESSLKSKPNVGIYISGSGAVGMTAAFGVLAGIRDCGLSNRYRYIGGSSGGGAGALLHIYSPLSDDDKIFLGSVLHPESINLDKMPEIEDKCILRAATKNFDYEQVTSMAFNKFAVWTNHIGETLQSAAGIDPNKGFAWNAETVDDILIRNSQSGMKHEDFVLPRKEFGPYLVVSCAYVEPVRTILDALRPASMDHRILDMTPIYTGQMRHTDVTYGLQQVTVGGLVESFACSGDESHVPNKCLGKEEGTGFVIVSKPHKMLALTQVAATAMNRPTGTDFDGSQAYFSPVSPTPGSISSTLSDAHSIHCNSLVPYVQRGVGKILLVSCPETDIDFATLMDPLSDKHWSKTKLIPGGAFDECIAAMFGIGCSYLINGRTVNKYAPNSQLFETNQFADVVAGLNAAFNKGTGTFYRKRLLTVKNSYGISAYWKVDVTFYVLTSSHVWDAKLPPASRQRLQAASEGAAGHCIPERGCFHPLQDSPIRVKEYGGFPHYANVGAYRGANESISRPLTSSEVRLLSSYIAWTFVQNKELLYDVLS